MFSRYYKAILAGLAVCAVLLVAVVIPWLVEDKDKLTLDCALTTENLEGVTPQPEVLSPANYEMTSIACYTSPGGGQVIIPEHIQRALDDSATNGQLFFVRMLITPAAQDSVEPRDAEEAELAGEIARLQMAGLQVEYFETWEYETETKRKPNIIVAGLLEKKQITDFPASRDYGYLLEWVTDGDGQYVEYAE